MVNMLQDEEAIAGQSQLFYTKFDVLSMERIVGSQVARKLLSGKSTIVLSK
jgi:hypothetical protein